MLKQIFGKNIKNQRKKRKWSQEKAAHACELSSKYWGKIERGTAAVSIDVMEKVSIGMGVKIEDLLKDEVAEASEKSVEKGELPFPSG